MCESTEQRICIKFCFKTGKTATEPYQLLQQAYGEDAMGRTQVFDWFRLFNPLKPNDAYRSRTAPLTSKVSFYIFIQQI